MNQPNTHLYAHLKPEVRHKPSSELKPGCHIKPLTPIGIRPSTLAELVEWCNNSAASVGIHQPLPNKPGYHCTLETFEV